MAFKMRGFSPLTQKVDPDAPGTPGKPGYEPPVKRNELDEMGKKIYDCNHKKGYKWNNTTKTCEKIK